MFPNQGFTVACLRIGNKFAPEYVYKLESMVKRHLTIPHMFVCFTTDPLPNINCYPAKRNLGPNPWWSKTHFFSPGLPYEGPLLYFDLDMTIVDNIDDLVTMGEEFVIIKQWKKILKRKDTIRRYNSSCMFFSEVGCRPKVWEEFTPKVPKRLRGDQDWIAEVYSDEATFPMEWFRAFEQCGPQGPPKGCKVVIHNKWDNHKVRNVPWVKEHWR